MESTPPDSVVEPNIKSDPLLVAVVAALVEYLPRGISDTKLEEIAFYVYQKVDMAMRQNMQGAGQHVSA